MAKRRKKISRKNRNIILGLLVSIASIYAVVSYVEMSRTQVISFFLSTVLFFVTIIILAVLVLGAFKVIGRLIHRNHDRDKE